MALVTSEPAAAGSSPAVAPVSDLAVQLAHVRRGFGEKPALVDLSISAPTGTITVLLGPNGAGKTTAVRMITGALTPESGIVRVFGLDPRVDGEEVRRRCGVVSAKPALYDRLSGRDNLAYSADLYQVSHAGIAPAAERFGISAALDQQVGGYSTGMKTRLALARSVLHDPELLLYDEPTSGLDPESSVAVLELIHEMAGEGRTIVMCTHLLLEAEGLADQVVVLEAGHDVISGPPAELTRRYWPDTVVRIAASLPDALLGLRSHPGVLGVDLDEDGRASVRLDDIERVPDLVDALVAAGARVTRVEPFAPTLEDLYFAVRGIRS
jgi:ABC-2 type transport system ATP-binding protein